MIIITIMNMEKSADAAMTTTTMIMTTRNTSIITTIMNMEKSVDVAMTITIMSITIITITVRQNHRQLVHTHIFR